MLCAIGGLAISFDIPLIKLANGEAWSVLLLRCIMTLGAGLLARLVWRALDKNAPALIPGRTGLYVAALYGIGSVLFIYGVYNTSTANLVFMLALNTVFAALLAWIFLKERPRPGTMLAMAAMVAGVAIIVRDSLGTGNFAGDMAGLASALVIAAAITITRATGKDMGLASLVGVVLPLSVAAVIVLMRGEYQIEAPWWIVFNGAIVIPIAFFCLATGPKYISGAEVAMFYLLETVLAPIWVWIIFYEAPTRNTLIGGSIIVIALVSHSLWQLSQGRQRKATQALRRPD